MAIAIEQHAGSINDDSVSTSIDVTFASAPTEDNLIVLHAGGGDGGEGITWPSGFTEVFSAGTAGQYDLRASATKVAGASEATSYTITFTGTSGDTFWGAGHEVSGQKSTDPEDVYASAVTTSGGTSQTTGTTAATSQGAAVALGAVCSWMSQDDTGSWSNSWTADEDLYESGGYNTAMWSGHKILSTIGTQESTVTWSGTSSDSHGLVLVILAETASSATATPSALAATSSFPAVTTANDVNATATPSALAATSSFPATARTASGVAEPGALLAVAGFPTVIAQTAQDASPSLTVLAATATFLAVTPVAIDGEVVQLSVLAVQATLPTPLVSGVINASASLTVLAATATFPAATGIGTQAATAVCTILTVAATFPAVTVTYTWNATAITSSLIVQGVFPATAPFAADLSYFYNQDVSIAVEVGFSDYPMVASPAWTDIAGDVRSFTITRGRGSELDDHRAGLLTVVIDNNAGDYDPSSSRAAYYPNLKPMKQIRIRASYDAQTYTLFRGFVESWPMQVKGYSDETVVLKAVDGLKVLQLQKDSSAQSAENSGTRVGHLLDEAGWPAGLRTIGSGVTSVPALTPDCATVLNLIKQVKDSEAGQFYIDGTGSAVFRNRTYRSGLSSLATFGDAAGQVPYQDIGFSYDDKQIWNRIEVFASGFPSYSSSTQSQDSYGIRTLSFLDILLPDTTSADDLADLYRDRYEEPQERIEKLVLKPEASPALMWPQALGLTLSDKVEVRYNTQGGSLKSVLSFIEGISHRVTVNRKRSWITTLKLSQYE